MKTLILFLGILNAGVAYGEEATAPWHERLSVTGDLRLRHHYVSKTKKADTSEAHKERYRARVALTGKVNEVTTAKVRLASSDDGNPVSTNSTFTGNSSKKSVYIDIVAVDWKLGESTNLIVGKQEIPLKPLKRSQLIYDDDYTPEGVAINVNRPMFVNVGAFSLLERAQNPTDGTSEPDSWLMGGIVGYRGPVSPESDVMVALGYHEFTALKRNAALNGGTAGSFLGNTSTGSGANGRYDQEYRVGQFLMESKRKLSNGTFSVYADFIYNFGADDNNTGIAAGTQFQTLDENGKPLWIFSYTYQTNGKNSTVSAINNSDLNNGIDGGFGHILTAGRTVASNTLVNLSFYRGKVDNSGNPFWIDVAQADVGVNF